MTSIYLGQGPNPVEPDLVELALGLVAFLVLLAIFTKVVAPRFERLYGERTARIEGGIADAEAARAKAAQALAEYRAQVSAARAEASAIRDRARAEAEAAQARVNAEAQDRVQRLIDRGEADLAAQRERVLADLSPELGRLALDLATRVIGEPPAQHIVDRVLTDSDAGRTPPALPR
ncbi:F0F1 ATP synthase subunit B [Actinokineospora sp. UTMC 2448]|uniref:F0F1 ATP synthase subunit B n=1 Tax=Actinokineospora sp. UTMC 2448 TaxID=2268449 RepID=UPI002164D3C1|nr:F0F1 ATP synthase subunit B [Actinokineospora sp. UTMC 2448]UVS80409.1 F-type ATPase subunit b [Actinokineospora sp. UTMC 2448]